MSTYQVIVDCIRDGKVIASYPLGIPITAGPSVPPSRQQLIEEAQFNLSEQSLAHPPYAGIEYTIREV